MRLASVLPGGALVFYPCRFIAARFPNQGDESNSLGIVRGSPGGSHSLKPRLANVDSAPAHSTQNRVYGFGSDDKWNLLELEVLFQLDAANKRLYFNPQKMDPDAGTGSLQKELTNNDGEFNTTRWDFQWDSNTYNSVKVRVLVDIRFDAATLTLKKVYRDIVFPKQLVSHINAPVPVTVLTGEEC